MKKFLALLLACALLTLAMAGCGGGQSSSSASNSSSGSSSSSSGSTADDSSSGSSPAAPTASSVSWWMDPQNMASNQIKSFSEHKAWQKYAEDVGIAIEWQEPPSGQASEQFNLILSSTNLPDIMYYSWASYPGGPDAAIADGKIVALQDYIQEYAPNFYAYLEIGRAHV